MQVFWGFFLLSVPQFNKSGMNGLIRFIQAKSVSMKKRNKVTARIIQILHSFKAPSFPFFFSPWAQSSLTSLNVCFNIIQHVSMAPRCLDTLIARHMLAVFGQQCKAKQVVRRCWCFTHRGEVFWSTKILHEFRFNINGSPDTLLKTPTLWFHSLKFF